MEKTTFIKIDESEKEVFLSDLVDTMNMPRAYNTKKRGFKEVASYIEKNRKTLESLTMYQVITELDKVKDLSFRSYCSMD